MKKLYGSGLVGLALVAFAALCWGTVGVAAQFLYNISAVGAIEVGFYRMALAVPALLIALGILVGKEAFKVKRSDLSFMLLMGLMLAFYQLFYFAAIARVGVAIATLVTLCSAPLIVAVLAWLVLGEKLTPKIVIALILALMGTVLLIQIDTVAASLKTTLVGVLLALGSATGYALVALISRRLAKHYHPLQATTIAFSFGSLVLLPFVLINGLTLSFTNTGWLTLLYIGLVPTALAYSLFVLGMRTIRATSASIVTLLEPLTATLLAWLLFNERLGLVGIMGGAALLSAIVLLAWQRPSKA